MTKKGMMGRKVPLGTKSGGNPKAIRAKGTRSRGDKGG